MLVCLLILHNSYKLFQLSESKVLFNDLLEVKGLEEYGQYFCW